MLFLLGGPPRCGKTTMAQHVCRSHGIPWMSTDTMRDVVAMLVPGFDDARAVGADPLREAELFAPYFERLCRSCAYLAEDYLIEGTGFTPSQVATLATELELRCVFVGRTSAPLAELLDREGRNQWPRHLGERERALLPSWVEEHSRVLRDGAATAGMPFVDVSGDFDRACVEAVQRLMGSD